MVSIFAAQFVNTGVLLLITNADFGNTVLSFLPASEGRFADLSESWYT